MKRWAENANTTPITVPEHTVLVNVVAGTTGPAVHPAAPAEAIVATMARVTKIAYLAYHLKILNN